MEIFHLSQVFARKEGLQKHTCPEVGQQKSLKCLLCSRSFLNPDLLEHHYLKHKGTYISKNPVIILACCPLNLVA